MSNLSDLMAQNERDAKLRDLLDQAAGGNYGSQTYIPQPYVTGPIGGGDTSDRGFGYTPMDQTASGGDVGPAAPPYVTGPIGVGDDSDRGFGQLQRTPNSSQGDVRRADLANVRTALAGIYGPVPNNWRSDQSQAGVIPDRSAPPQQPMQPAERPELVPNQFRNERTGVVTTLSPPPPDRQTQPQSNNGVTILDSQQQRDGSLLQLVSFPGVDGFGRQTMKKEIRRVIPDELNPQVKAQQDFRLREANIAAAQGRTPQQEAEAERLKILARERAERDAAGLRSPEQVQARAAERLGVRLKPGEQIDPATGRVTAVQGSAAWNKQQGELQSAKEQRDQFVNHTDQMIKNIDLLIGSETEPKDHPGLRGATGMIDARLPGFTEDQTNAQVAQKALLAKAAVSGLQEIRKSGTAPGSITEKEWPIFQSLNDILDPLQGETAYRKSLIDARARLQGAKSNVQNNYMAVEQRVGGAPQPKNTIEIQQSLFNARKHIQANPANAAAVKARLRAAGIDDSGL